MATGSEWNELAPLRSQLHAIDARNRHPSLGQAAAAAAAALTHSAWAQSQAKARTLTRAPKPAALEMATLRQEQAQVPETSARTAGGNLNDR